MTIVRHATENDLPAMLAIYNDIIVNTTAVWDYEEHTLEMRQQWFAAKQEQGLPVFVADEDGNIMGFCSLGPFRPWVGYQQTVENSVYVTADCRGRGIGKLLLQRLIDAAKDLKKHVIIAAIEAENETSILLHRKFGFTEVAHFKEVGYKFGRWLDVKFLELMI